VGHRVRAVNVKRCRVGELIGQPITVYTLPPSAEKDAAMQDRRSIPRLDVVIKVRFERNEDFQEALIHNISQMGVYLATDRPFDVGYQFLIEIDLPNDKGQIKGTCEVIWVNEVEAKDYPKGMGVQFVELTARYQEILEDYLRELGNA
jgi:uncharacterized protein (TIGR02266 family)